MHFTFVSFRFVSLDRIVIIRCSCKASWFMIQLLTCPLGFLSKNAGVLLVSPRMTGFSSTCSQIPANLQAALILYSGGPKAYKLHFGAMTANVFSSLSLSLSLLFFPLPAVITRGSHLSWKRRDVRRPVVCGDRQARRRREEEEKKKKKNKN